MAADTGACVSRDSTLTPPPCTRRRRAVHARGAAARAARLARRPAPAAHHLRGARALGVHLALQRRSACSGAAGLGPGAAKPDPRAQCSTCTIHLSIHPPIHPCTVRLLFQHARRPLDAYWLKEVTNSALDERGVGACRAGGTVPARQGGLQGCCQRCSGSAVLDQALVNPRPLQARRARTTC